MMKPVDKYLDKIQQEISPVLFGASVALSAATLIVHATKVYKDYFTKVARQCSDLAPQDKAMCMLRAKQLALNVQLQTLKGDMSKCDKVKNKGECLHKIKAKLSRIQGEVDFYKQRYKEVRNQYARNR